jgi:hypothetical protein
VNLLHHISKQITYSAVLPAFFGLLLWLPFVPVASCPVGVADCPVFLERYISLLLCVTFLLFFVDWPRFETLVEVLEAGDTTLF